MGVVWKARDEETGQIVALKLLHPVFAADPEYVTRFERELELANRIHSRNVVQVLGYGVRDGAPYLAHEYVNGPSLCDLINRQAPYSWPHCKALLAQIAQGLAGAHTAGVIHRDLKPSNVLIGSDGVAKLADFGIAKGLDLARVTGTSTLLGTPAYLAPEGPQDERSDLYSLGVIAYEMLAGVVPFEGRTYQEVILRHVREAPDLDKLPVDARQVVGWLLAKDRADRPQSARALLAVLDGGQKVPAVAATVAAVAATVPVAQGPQLGSRDTSLIVRNETAPAATIPSSARRSRAGVAIAALAALVLAFAAGATLLAFVPPGAETTPSTAPPGIAGALVSPSSFSIASLGAADAQSASDTSGSTGPAGPNSYETGSASPRQTQAPLATATPAPGSTSVPPPGVASPTPMPTPLPTPTPRPTPTPPPPPTPAPGKYSQVTGGAYDSCAIKTGGAIACWGDNSYGQTNVPSGTYNTLTAGAQHNCGLKTNGTIACWGDNSYGQTTVPSGTYIGVGAGERHTCAIKTGGALVCWGDNSLGQKNAPTGTFTAVSIGGNHSCAINSSGTVVCWGENNYGQSNSPSGKYYLVAAGRNHTCALRTDVTVYCWGDSGYGQTSPPSGKYASVSRGADSTCGMKSDATVACWGRNDYGQVSNKPAGTYLAVGAGWYHSCAIKKSDSSIICWGLNNHGQAPASK
jgi:serine/threonine protein kinase